MNVIAPAAAGGGPALGPMAQNLLRMPRDEREAASLRLRLPDDRAETLKKVFLGCARPSHPSDPCLSRSDCSTRQRLRNSGDRLAGSAEHEVHELARYNDRLHDLVAVEVGGDLGRLAGKALLLLVGSAGGHGHAVPELAVHLHHDLVRLPG